jgi:hypothetical protein
MMEPSALMLQQIKDEFYSVTPKRSFFGKTSQKMECAHRIATRFSVQELLRATVFPIPHTNKLYFDYTLFKMYATPDHYEPIVTYMTNEINALIDTHAHFELHVNLQTFSVSAAERYRDAIQMFGASTRDSCGGECMRSCLHKLYIYHTPCVMHSIAHVLAGILSRCFNEDIRRKVIMVDKESSSGRIRELFESVQV